MEEGHIINEGKKTHCYNSGGTITEAGGMQLNSAIWTVLLPANKYRTYSRDKTGFRCTSESHRGGGADVNTLTEHP